MSAKRPYLPLRLLAAIAGVALPIAYLRGMVRSATFPVWLMSGLTVLGAVAAICGVAVLVVTYRRVGSDLSRFRRRVDLGIVLVVLSVLFGELLLLGSRH